MSEKPAKILPDVGKEYPMKKVEEIRKAIQSIIVTINDEELLVKILRFINRLMAK